MTPEERTVLERTRVATLATADDDGRPHAVPICYAILDGVDSAHGDDPDHRIVSAIDEKPKSARTLQRVRDIRANPFVTLLVDYYSEDWSQLAWIQVRGRARVVSSDSGGSDSARDETEAETDERIHTAAVDALESKYDQYADHDLDDRPIIDIRVGRTLSWGALETYS